MVGIVGGMKHMGNTKLVPCGIQTEKSDLRAHVSISARGVYLFPTKNGSKITDQCRKMELGGQKPPYFKVQVKTGQIVTAEGYLVPPDDIPGCLRIPIPLSVFLGANFKPEDQYGCTTIRGDKAVAIVKEMLKLGLIPVTLEVNEVTDQDLQISGTDIIVKAQARIQVKCDWRAGHRDFGGTGNLFLQVAECNPNGWH